MPEHQKPRSSWYVYLIECRDGSLYTGIAVDVALRYAKHAAGKGARYTRAHPPLRLLGQCACPDRAEASRAEYRIKRLSPAQKQELCDSWKPEASELTGCVSDVARVERSETQGF